MKAPKSFSTNTNNFQKRFDVDCNKSKEISKESKEKRNIGNKNSS